MAIGYLRAKPGDQVVINASSESPDLLFLYATLDDRSLSREANPIARWPAKDLASGVTFAATTLNGYDIFFFATIRDGATPASVLIQGTVAGQKQFNHTLLFDAIITYREIKVFVSYA